MKWEYLQDELNFCPTDNRYYWTYSSGWFKTKESALNYLGYGGWELVTIESASCCYTFKRQISED